MASDDSLPRESHIVAVIGAGVGGLTFGIKATQKFGTDFDFAIYEKASGIGGTWRANEYPGCSCDVFVHFYSLSTDLNPDFSISHPYNGELLSYWQSLSNKYHLDKHIEFRSEVTGVEWDLDSSRWNLTIGNLETGKKKLVTARFVISALGILEVPNFGNIPGMDRFKGVLFHSSQWRSEIALDEKRVAVIGNGASSAQFVPIISKEESTSITQFCRTPNWYIRNLRVSYSGFQRWLFKRIPFYLRFYRLFLFMRTELLYFMLFAFPRLRELLMSASRRYIRQNAPKDMLSFLLPTYQMGCKRIILDTGYLAALHRPNLTINHEPIDEIVAGGIKSKTGEVLPFDVIILATGYVADSFPLPIIGRTGQTIQEYYDARGGPIAYRGTTVPTFPNLFILGGPNTGTGHTSVIYTEEVQANYVIQSISALIAKSSSPNLTMEVKQSACDKYNEWLEKRLGNSVFLTCESWYRVGGVGKVSSIWPGSSSLFWWNLRKVIWNDYSLVSVKDRKED